MARSTIHEWVEDSLLPNTDTVAGLVDSNTFQPAHVEYYRVGDTIRVADTAEIMLVTAIDTVAGTIDVTRGYGNTDQATLAADMVLNITGNSSLEGADAGSVRYTNRSRAQNYTQIFASTLSVSGSELAVNQIGVRDELAWQKNLRTRELLRDLENSVINGVASATTPQGSGTVRRTMRGILSFVTTNQFAVGEDDFPTDEALTEAQLNLALRQTWNRSAGGIDLIVVGGREKRAINQFIASNRRFTQGSDSFKDMVSVYESDFGVCRVVLSRYVPTGTVLLLDSSRISVIPLAGRSFHYSPLARTGDAETGQMIGEYTMELRNESAHAVIRGFTA